MRQFFCIFFTILFAIVITACGGSSTGPETEPNENQDTAIYSVSVSMNPSNAGHVAPADGTYEEGKEIQVLAHPGDGYMFTGWTGDTENAGNPISLTVDKDYELTANFELKPYELTINKEGEGSVQEHIVQQKINEYEEGTVVELIATPAKGYRFARWKDDLEGTGNPAEITVDSPKQVTAVFEKKDYELSVTTEGSGAVSEQVVSRAKAYEYGDVVELTPTPGVGWEFVEWEGDLAGSDNPTQITVDTTKTVTAVFERKTFSLNIDIQGEGSIARDPDQSEYDYGDKVTLTANPSEGWSFKEWAGEISGTTPEITVTIHSERDITAVFEENPLFYVAKNGITVMCPEAEPGKTGFLNGGKYGGEIYKAVDRPMLEQMIANNEDVTTGICTSPITDMSELFRNATNFNEDISSWDVSSVTDMSVGCFTMLPVSMEI